MRVFVANTVVCSVGSGRAVYVGLEQTSFAVSEVDRWHSVCVDLSGTLSRSVNLRVEVAPGGSARGKLYYANQILAIIIATQSEACSVV